MQSGADKRIIFVVGNSRSGTTMMGRILNNNNQVFTFGELHFYGQIFDPVSEKNKPMGHIDSVILFAKLICKQRKGYFANCHYLDEYMNEATKALNAHHYLPEDIYCRFLDYETTKHQKSIPCEQTPRNLFFIESILNLPSKIKIITMVRDPRDVLISQKNKWKRRFLGGGGIPMLEAIRSWFNYHPITMAMIWKSAMLEYSKFKNNENVLLVKYEDFLEKPEIKLKEITSFLNISFEPQMLNVPHEGSSEHKDSGKKGINSKRKNLWKQNGKINRTEIYICEKICGPVLEQYGYEPSGYKPNPFTLIYYLFVFPAKSIGSLLLNLKRFKNIKKAISRRIAIRNDNAA